MEEGKFNIFVSVRFVNMEEVAEYNGPEDFVRSIAWTDGAAEVSHTMINDYDVYYLAIDRAYIAKKDTVYDYHFYGVIPLKNGIFYLLEGRSGTNADAMKLETYMNFLTFS